MIKLKTKRIRLPTASRYEDWRFSPVIAQRNATLPAIHTCLIGGAEDG
jgi:hypothetical protein